MTRYIPEARRWGEPEIVEVSEALAGTVTNAFGFVRNEEIDTNALRNLGTFDTNHHRSKIRNLVHFYRGLIGNIEVLLPSPADPALDHLAFIEAIIRSRIIAGPNPAFNLSDEETVLLELHNAVDELCRVRKLGSNLIDRWNEASGEHFICEHDGGCELGTVGEARADVLTVDYIGLDRSPTHPTAVSYANWLLNVDEDYPLVRLHHVAAVDPIAAVHLSDAPLTRTGAWSGYSEFVETETGLSAGNMRGIQDPVRHIVAGDARVRSYIDQLSGNRAEKINLFVRRSDPRVAVPFLRPILEGAENPDMADIIHRVRLHHSEDTGRQRPLNARGKQWLRGLGIIG